MKKKYLSALVTILLISGTVLITAAPGKALAAGPGDARQMKERATKKYYDLTPSLTEEQARQIALQHAGVAESDATFMRTGLDYDYGRLKYEIEFYSGRTEYDYEIDAATGEILSFDYDAEYDWPAGGVKPSVNEKASANAKTYANAKGSEKAKAYANAKAHANAGSSANTKSSANVKAPGAASSAKERAQAGGLNNAGTNAQAQAGMLTQQQALEIALQHAGVKAQDISRQRIKLDYEHGRQVYEIEFNVGWTEYSYDVDAANGEILSFEMDMDD